MMCRVVMIFMVWSGVGKESGSWVGRDVGGADVRRCWGRWVRKVLIAPWEIVAEVEGMLLALDRAMNGPRRFTTVRKRFTELHERLEFKYDAQYDSGTSYLISRVASYIHPLPYVPSRQLSNSFPLTFRPLPFLTPYRCSTPTEPQQSASPQPHQP